VRTLIFVSSVQKELAFERRAVADFVRGHVLLRRFFDVFLFEELPATDRRTDNLYLEKVDAAAIYLGLFGREYGWEDTAGLSPTEREFDRATHKGKHRLVFVKGSQREKRHRKMQALIRKAERQLVRRRFEAIFDLTAELFASLVQYLADSGILHERPFLATASPDASIRDVSAERVGWFLGRARAERQFPLKATASPREVLTHLNLLAGARPSQAAILLFGANPQRFVPVAELKCLHFHGTEVRKPIPSYQLFKGTLFEQVDQAVDFVLAKLARAVGTRARGPAAPVAYEIPKEVVAEAVVNAAAHRDYTSNAGIQVHVFSDRVEVWNPGGLPPDLTPERLREEHPSIPRNPLLAEALYLARYIEKAGTGTLDMIQRCRAGGLPEPDFAQRGGQFVVTLWRAWLTDAALDRLGLSDRQRQAIALAKQNGRISTRDYRDLAGVTDRTALRDLQVLVGKKILHRVGATGRGTHYVIRAETRHQPDKPDTRRERRQTRQKPDKPDTAGTRGQGSTMGSASRPIPGSTKKP
jgi:predicted HTH transcriptional regulator